MTEIHIEVCSGSDRSFFRSHHSIDFRKHVFGCIKVTDLFQCVHKLKITDTESRILHFAKEDINGKPRLPEIHG
jgi:hypothetical protein